MHVCVLKEAERKASKYKVNIAKPVNYLNLHSLCFVYLSLICNVGCLNVLISSLPNFPSGSGPELHYGNGRKNKALHGSPAALSGI